MAPHEDAVADLEPGLTGRHDCQSSPPIPGSHIPPREAAQIIVITLGTSSPDPRAQDPCSSCLVEAGGSRLWIDTGAGTLSALLRHCSLEELDAVWVSHTHADHFSDLAVSFYALRYADIHRQPLTVFGPPGWAERLRTFLSHSTGPGVAPVLVHHDAPCFGVRVHAADVLLAYTGDTGPCAGLTELVSDADLLISEARYGLGEGDVDPVHLTAAQAGAVARDGHVGQLLLTHLAGADITACVRATAENYSAPVIGAPCLVVNL
ncbi:MAG: MBL fold metallo-hydrolase [Actinomycetota bacterium]|nr:MBL fold metallo-hydrolase [Actinomycetota bacterium]